MIEEAAGTRMYEAKKRAALKTMEKKDIKVLNAFGVFFLCLKILNKEILFPQQFLFLIARSFMSCLKSGYNVYVWLGARD